MAIARYSILLSLLILFSTIAHAGDVIFQTSTLDALMEGVYDGNFTFGELKKHGDFGLGTFNDLDGEMIGLGGIFYQVRSDGKVSVVPDDARTPFAVVTFFEADESLPLLKKLGCNELESYIESLLPTKNILYALKIEGKFDYVKARSVPKQNKPFPPLTEAVKRETCFELKNVKGTMAGFWLPGYVKDINATGFHLHFISDDRKSGGHVLDCTARDVKIEIDYSRGLDISLPDTGSFYNADLSGMKDGDVKQVESEKK